GENAISKEVARRSCSTNRGVAASPTSPRDRRGLHLGLQGAGMAKSIRKTDIRVTPAPRLLGAGSLPAKRLTGFVEVRGLTRLRVVPDVRLSPTHRFRR